MGDKEVRDRVRRWGSESWNEYFEVVLFRWKKFKLDDFSGRQELGTVPVWYLIGWILFIVVLFPVLLVYVWVRELLEAIEVIDEAEHKVKPAPGVIVVSGSKSNPGPTSLIDTVKRARRRLWLVVSRSRVAVVVLNDPEKPPRVIWQSDESASVRFHHASQQSIEVAWPDGCRAYFCPTSEERKLVTRFANATRDSEPR
ncbi:hypothetical protein SAMN04487905_109188 [Actinopolyspora xinjiangensis]|uniref:Uncharacterized protein n=1 Tax=Actinopolyspora xinjiangensis TaxID=405564 RepID=A0A1H0VRT6_9ACTN|nr:hypothetical protein SAMN04487905_109188 [Actinopolyspora xinjiangensis]